MSDSAYKAIKGQDSNKSSILLSLVKDAHGNHITKEWAVQQAVNSMQRSERNDESAFLRGLKLVCDIEGFIKERASGKAAEYNRYTSIIQTIVLKNGEEDAPSPEQIEAARKFARIPETVDVDYEEVGDE